MEHENIAFREYLAANGYDLSLIGMLMDDAQDPERLDAGADKAVLHDKAGVETTVTAGPLYESK